ncbi:MAG: hypothetical protein KDD33_09865 [Bdellovibrionales bacterium]|nr:hypothetical protein [Bdellovibrionales bacterium]
MWPKTMTMVDPEFFDVKYAINPHMTNEKGELNTIDKPKARAQWNALKNSFESLGMTVEVLAGIEGLPDMVFCANQTFPFIQSEKKSIVLSQMQSEYRQPEVQAFRSWAQSKDWETFEVKGTNFEGMGDALWDYEGQRIFGGFGFRTHPEVYSQLERWVEQPIIALELVDDRFYHLDTCLAILGRGQAAFVEEAFSTEAIATLKGAFDVLLPVPIDEATRALACNMCCVNGRDVIIDKKAKITAEMLDFHLFEPHLVDTSEYIKSGGSVFCMKQLLF